MGIVCLHICRLSVMTPSCRIDIVWFIWVQITTEMPYNNKRGKSVGMNIFFYHKNTRKLWLRLVFVFSSLWLHVNLRMNRSIHPFMKWTEKKMLAPEKSVQVSEKSVRVLCGYHHKTASMKKWIQVEIGWNSYSNRNKSVEYLWAFSF